MQDRVKRTVLAGGAAVAAVALAVTMDGTAAGAATAAKRPAFGGSAYGSAANLGSVVRSGKTAYVPLCTTATGASNANKTAAVHLPGVGTIGAVTTRVSSAKAGGTVSSVTTTSTAGTSLLGGLVHARAITTRARVSLRGTTYHRVGSSTLVGLTIAGHAVNNRPKVNTTITIPGIGRVILNKQATSTSQGQHTLTVVALQVVLKAGNVSAIPAGNIVVGHAFASLHAPTHHLAYGSAYGTKIQVGSTLASGATAPVYLPCGGSSGVTNTNNIAAARLPGVLSAGAVTSSARSSDTTTTTSAATASHIASVNLLGGAVKVRAITTQARATRHGSHLSLSSTGTKLVGLTVNGRALSVPAPNTGRNIPGLGTLYFDRVSKTRTGIRVYALQLVLSESVGSVARGTVITIGAASAGVRN